MEQLVFPPLPNKDDDVSDWEYNMRREMQEIIPGLYLGPYSAASKSKLENLMQHHVTHIVCIRQDMEKHIVKPNFPEHFTYLVLNISDWQTENIIQYFPQVREFLDCCLNSRGRVLIHGNAGVSRSAAMVIAYLMQRFGLAYEQAFRHVQERRFCISLNQGFEQQLKEYEPIYRASMQYQSEMSNDCVLKRKFEETM